MQSSHPHVIDRLHPTSHRFGGDPRFLCHRYIGCACPILRGDPCPAIDRADVLVYDVWSTTESDGGQHLIEGIRELHPDIPVVLTAPGIELDWVTTSGSHRVTPLVGVPTAERLAAAIDAAMASTTQE